MSSLLNLKKQSVRLGSTKVILSGSIFTEPNYNLPVIDVKNKNIVFFSTWIPINREGEFHSVFNIVRKWAINNPDYQLLVKLHPLESSDYWKKVAKEVKNITCIDGNTSIKKLLEDVVLVVVRLSNASIEAALLNRPIVTVNPFIHKDDYLSLDSFFLSAAKDEKELHENIEYTIHNYDRYVDKCNKFTDFHLEYKKDAVVFIAKCIDSIFNKMEVTSFEFLSEKLNY